MSSTEPPVQRDLASNVGRMAMSWGPGVLLLVVTAPFAGWARSLGWAAGLTWLGAVCLLNLARCGRVHCAFTGPFFLIMALASLLAGFGVLSVGANPWNVLSEVILIGAVVLYCVPELIWGRYWRRSGN